MNISKEVIWVSIGLMGQALFTMRFLTQWIATEKAKKSTIPIIFWYLSIFGGLTLLSYAIYRKDPVFILGQSFGIVVYARNLYFIYTEKNNTPGLHGSQENKNDR